MQRRPLNQYRRAKMLHYLSIEDFCSKISSGGLLEKSSRAGVCLYVCMHVCLSVSPSIFASGAQTAGPIVTGEYLFDAPERRKYDGKTFRPIGCRWHVPLAISQTLAKNCYPGCRANQWTDSAQTWRPDSHHG